jgi:SMI1 / KNR4 family (SUKH-1)
VSTPTEPRFISRAEDALGIRLPREYREFLLLSNGAELAVQADDWQIFPVFDDSDRKRAARTSSHIVHETSEARRWGSFPPAGVAIGSNGSGDRLLFLPDPRDPGVLRAAVYLWAHETGACEEICSSFRKLAGSDSDL